MGFSASSNVSVCLPVGFLSVFLFLSPFVLLIFLFASPYVFPLVFCKFDFCVAFMLHSSGNMNKSEVVLYLSFTHGLRKRLCSDKRVPEIGLNLFCVAYKLKTQLKESA